MSGPLHLHLPTAASLPKGLPAASLTSWYISPLPPCLPDTLRHRYFATSPPFRSATLPPCHLATLFPHTSASFITIPSCCPFTLPPSHLAVLLLNSIAPLPPRHLVSPATPARLFCLRLLPGLPQSAVHRNSPLSCLFFHFLSF